MGMDHGAGILDHDEVVLAGCRRDERDVARQRRD
jgi:hypothetical protein